MLRVVFGRPSRRRWSKRSRWMVVSAAVYQFTGAGVVCGVSLVMVWSVWLVVLGGLIVCCEYHVRVGSL